MRTVLARPIIPVIRISITYSNCRINVILLEHSIKYMSLPYLSKLERRGPDIILSILVLLVFTGPVWSTVSILDEAEWLCELHVHVSVENL